MTTDNAKIKISVSEVAAVLHWPYSTASSIKKRKAPAEKYEIYLECEQKLKDYRKKINKELTEK